MSIVRGILFDMDGTLVDAFSPIVYALNQTLNALNLPLMSEEDIKRHTGRGESSIRTLFGDRREEAIDLFLRYHDERLYDLTAIPDAEIMLKWAKYSGISVAVVTNKSQSRAELQLKYLGWTNLIDYVVGLKEGRIQKPDPHVLYLACEYLNIKPSEAVVIGDGIADMQAAVSAGCTAIGLVNTFSESELEEAGATHCFSTLSEAKHWLNTQIQAY